MNRTALFTRESWSACWKSPLFRAALLVLVTLLAYLPATHGGYIWDDDVYVTENPLLSAPDGLRRIWFTTDSPSQYFPLVYTTFRFEYAIWGLNPAGYHWVNILLHIANALLVWRLLWRLGIPGAWLAAMIFALHPVHVESVAWITERKNVLSVFFSLLALLAWTEFIRENTRKKWAFYAAALACCALALFSKTTACTLPAALFLILWFKHKLISWRRIFEIAPFLAQGIGMGLLTVWWERYHQGTHGKLFALGLADRLLIATHAVWFYLGKLLLPVNLTFSYPHWTLQPGNPLAWCWLLAMIPLAWAVYCAREDIGRSGEVALFYFVATLSPMLGFIMLYTFLYSFVADHYQYAASIGPIALISAGVVTLAKSCKKISGRIYGVAAVVVLLLGAQTWRQCHIYFSGEKIWIDTLEKNPGSLMASFNLANEIVRPVKDGGHGDLEGGLKLYNHAVEIDPTFVDARVNRADCLVAMGRLQEAEADYTEALKLDQNNTVVKKEYLVFQKRLGDLLAAHGNYAGALPHYQEDERFLPDNPQSHLELGSAWLGMGKPGETIREYREAIRLDPQSIIAQARLAWVLAACDDPDLRNPAEALDLAQRACDLTHQENPVALETLAAAYAANGRFADAVSACLSALDIANNTGNAQLAAGIKKEMELYQKGRPLYR